MSFVLITRTDCKWCDKAKEALVADGVEFMTFNYETSPDIKDFLIASNLKTVPQIWRNGRYIGGCNELMAYLHEHKE